MITAFQETSDQRLCECGYTFDGRVLVCTKCRRPQKAFGTDIAVENHPQCYFVADPYELWCSINITDQFKWGETLRDLISAGF